jgi:hypothetical protein
MKRKKRSGNSPTIGRRGALVILTGVASLPCRPVALAAFQKNAPYSVVAGTVFQENGFSFPGVSVTLTPKTSGGKKQSDSTSFRGEFSFRVPPGAATYTVTASKKGFVTSSVEAVVPGEGRVDVTITLPPESKK